MAYIYHGGSDGGNIHGRFCLLRKRLHAKSLNDVYINRWYPLFPLDILCSKNSENSGTLYALRNS